jgi:hypothetical protein
MLRIFWPLRICAIWCLMLAVAAAAAAVEAGRPDGVYTVIRSAAIRGAGIEAARQEALAGALASAAARAAAEMLPQEDLVAAFETLNAAVFENTDRFIQSYRVLTEAKAGGHYRLLVEARVALAALEERLSGVGLQQERPQAADGPAVIEVVVAGTRNLKNFIQFRQRLSGLAGVTALSTQEMTADRTTLVVTYQGNARELADALMMNTFDAFGVRIYDVSDFGLQVELIPQ